MPPQIATLLCLGLIGGLFWLDRKGFKGFSPALWVPLLWMFFAGSRFASQWLALGMPEMQSAQGYNDGSPLDRNIFLGLVLVGIWVLMKRNVDWGALFVRNAWILLFFLYSAVSVVWSDDPFIASKRWIKGVGNLVAALILLTELRPFVSLSLILRFLGFVLVPLSVLFIRYFPDLGRGYHWGGQPMYTGVTFSKNSLGQLCLILGVYFCWELITNRSRAEQANARIPWSVYVVMLPCLAWLIRVADCATCSSLMVVAVSILLAGRLPSFARRPKRFVVIGVVAAALVAGLEQEFQIKDSVIRMLGREPDLTTRTPIWDILLEMAPHKWIGAGYESFWSGDRLTEIWARLGNSSIGIIQAHNGYIETYLNLGFIGLAILTAALLTGAIRAVQQLEVDYSNAMLRLVIIIVVAIYNYTEAAYKPVNNMFVVLLFALIEIPRRVRRKVARVERPMLPAGGSGKATR